jgi:hypothetical protein
MNDFPAAAMDVDGRSSPAMAVDVAARLALTANAIAALPSG